MAILTEGRRLDPFYKYEECPEINIDYPKNDLRQTIEETWQKCAEKCGNTVGCEYWTWTPPESAPKYPKWCFLKTAKGNVNHLYKAVSGAKGCREFSPDNDPKAPTKFPALWKNSGRCGASILLEDGQAKGKAAQCNPGGDHCCSPNTWCGKTDAYCNCNGCKDYSPVAQASRSCTDQDSCRITFLNLPNPNGGDWRSGYEKNGRNLSYASSDDAYENGCYGYTSGKFAGHYFFGTKGNDAEKKTPLFGEKIRTECNSDAGWGKLTEWSSYANLKNEVIQCPNPGSYIVQSTSRWTNIDDDDKQIKWLCSPPDNNIVTGVCRWYEDWSNDEEENGDQKCNKEEVMVGIKKTYFDGAGQEDDWKYQIRCCKLGNGKSEKPNSCEWGVETWKNEPNIWSNYEDSDYSKDEKNPLHWDDKVYFTGMRTKFMDDDDDDSNYDTVWGTKQNRVLRFRTCEFGCKVINIEILDKPNFIDKGWQVAGKQALWDCESDSISLGLSNEVSVEESVELEVSDEYTNEVNGEVTVGITVSADAKLLGLGAGVEKSTEFSTGYSHSWTNGRSETKGKATATSTGTSLDKSIESSDGVAAWVLMYTKKIELETQKVKAIYTKQCGAQVVKEIGNMTIAAQRYTSFKMDIERYNFDTRNECAMRRKQVQKSTFEKELDNTWGAEAPRQESKFRRDFWRALKYDMLPCGIPAKSFKQVSYQYIDYTTRCNFGYTNFGDIKSYEECKDACSYHGENIVAYLPDDPNGPRSPLSNDPDFKNVLAALKGNKINSDIYTKYPGCFLRQDAIGKGHSGYMRDLCIWNGNLDALDKTIPNWQYSYWPMDLSYNYYPLCQSACPKGD